MSLKHQSTRLTVEQQQRAINLAAQLQERYHETLRVDELAAIAEEAGIRSEFVYEALSHQIAEDEERPVIQDSQVIDRFILGLILTNTAITLFPAIRGPFQSSAAGILPLLMAAITGYRGLKSWRLAWTGPTAILLTLCVTQGIYVALHRTSYDGANTSIANLIAIELLISIAVAICCAVIGAWKTRSNSNPDRTHELDHLRHRN